MHDQVIICHEKKNNSDYMIYLCGFFDIAFCGKQNYHYVFRIMREFDAPTTFTSDKK